VLPFVVRAHRGDGGAGRGRLCPSIDVLDSEFDDVMAWSGGSMMSRRRADEEGRYLATGCLVEC
jgi:hypothetical protein